MRTRGKGSKKNSSEWFSRRNKNGRIVYLKNSRRAVQSDINHHAGDDFYKLDVKYEYAREYLHGLLETADSYGIDIDIVDSDRNSLDVEESIDMTQPQSTSEAFIKYSAEDHNQLKELGLDELVLDEHPHKENVALELNNVLNKAHEYVSFGEIIGQEKLDRLKNKLK